MNAPQKRSRRSTLETLLTFIVLFLAIQFGLRFLFPEQFGGANGPQRPPVELTAESATVREGHHPILLIRNNTDEDIALEERCPMPPVDIAIVRVLSTGAEQVTDISANTTVLPCDPPTTVPAGETVRLDMAPWKYSLFDDIAVYQATLELGREDIADPVTRFEIAEVGTITRLFRGLITKPLLNAVIFIAGHVPGHNLGVAIIIITLLIKLLLLVPNQHALEGQKKLTELQPKLDELKKKYPDDPKRQQDETLKLWKQHKINPMQSCLPMLIQFPILIGLFFVIRDGAVLELSRHLIYPAYQDLNWSFGTMFLGLDLTQRSLFIMPPLLVILQYIQMKMAFARKKTKDGDKKKVIDVGETGKPSWMPELNQQTVMLYGLPIMIGFFALQFQAAVSLYWGVSTLFAIAQQWFVNRK